MKKKWIKKSIREPGSLRKTAKRAKALTKKGTIKKKWLKKQAKKGSAKTAKRARLALTLSKLRKRR